jgi:endonuclease/exonuclease/phosphatase family metal-dependent hydrolase
MGIQKYLLFLLLFPLLSWGEAANLNIFSYNTFMLPWPLKSSRQAERRREHVRVLRELENVDLLVLTEAFTPKYRQSIRKGLRERFPHQTHLGARHPFQMTSGVQILSKHPMRVLGRAFYREARHADKYAAKGVLLVEITLPSGQVVQVAGTHMQSGGVPESRRIRATQLEQIRQLLAQHARPGVPQILTGDLNINALEGDEFQESLNTMGMESGSLTGEVTSSIAQETTCFGLPTREKPKWIDHTWINRNGSQAAITEHRIEVLRGRVNNQVCELSDHRPIFSSVRLPPQPSASDTAAPMASSAPEDCDLTPASRNLEDLFAIDSQILTGEDDD